MSYDATTDKSIIDQYLCHIYEESLMSEFDATDEEILSVDANGESNNEDSKFDFLGSPLSSLAVDDVELPALKPSEMHTVMFKVPLKTGLPVPYPHEFHDVWDSECVRMPCSSSNQYPLDNGDSSKKELVSRWELIKSSLSDREISSSVDLQESILRYNSRYAAEWKFAGLHTLFTDCLSSAETEHFFEEVLPEMVSLALKLPEICTGALPFLKRQKPRMLSLSQQQAACLLCNAFFCTFPLRNRRKRNWKGSKEFDSYPVINFSSLFNSTHDPNLEKLKCLIHYFNRVTAKMPTGTLSFERRCLNSARDWLNSPATLRELHVNHKGTIEDDGAGMLQMDFANRFLGGGVLEHGCVQEEIRFVICPELIVSCLFTEALEDNECLILTGCERFSNYTGYGDTFTWCGNYADETPRDSWRRRRVCVVAVDAMCFHRGSRDQYKPVNIDRELLKAYVGFAEQKTPSKKLAAVATGNWGCGAFGGDYQLKSIIQLLAAAESQRNMAYFTYGSSKIMKDLYDVYKFLLDRKLSVGCIYNVLIKYHDKMKGNANLFPIFRGSKQQTVGVFEFLKKEFKNVSTSDSSSSDS